MPVAVIVYVSTSLTVLSKPNVIPLSNPSYGVIDFGSVKFSLNVLSPKVMVSRTVSPSITFNTYVLFSNAVTRESSFPRYVSLTWLLFAVALICKFAYSLIVKLLFETRFTV